MLVRTTRTRFPKTPLAVFKFRGCLNEASSTGPRPRQKTTLTIPATSEDTSLIPFIDLPNARRTWSTSPSGLFNHRDLTEPRSLTLLAEGSLLRAGLLTNRILQAKESKRELLLALKNLDKLSDLLCSVIDLAEVVRNCHPDEAWVQCANDAYDMLCEFMNELNTHVGLYEVLKRVFSNPTVVDSLSQEAYYTALIFWRDFEKSAIKLPLRSRQKFVSLSSEIISLGREFLNETASARPPALITPSELDGLKDLGMGTRLHLQAHFTNRPLAVYPGSLQAQMIMRSAPLEDPRRKLHIAANSSSPKQIHTLERLLRARAELAQLCGKESYAHLTLNDKMAKSPAMIGRTEYQNVSGTRCATDFVELPSILMEHFLSSSTILSLFNPDYGNSIPPTANHHIDPCHSIDTHTQILLACLDQEYHSSSAAQSNFDSTQVYAKLHETKGLIPFVPGTSWQTQFGHLYGYGATYYSYLFDRAIASRVWTNIFAADPLDRESGERFKNEVLKYGGGKDPWSMVSTLLSAPELESGDAEAMAAVGHWRIEDEILTRH
ncbi:hypothetical protein M0805_003541 [Coniferiporia weirii]|nr:hypothetical protein M0805_003541 [Coniferiporia weirii]